MFMSSIGDRSVQDMHFLDRAVSLKGGFMRLKDIRKTTTSLRLIAADLV